MTWIFHFLFNAGQAEYAENHIFSANFVTYLPPYFGGSVEILFRKG